MVGSIHLSNRDRHDSYCRTHDRVNGIRLAEVADGTWRATAWVYSWWRERHCHGRRCGRAKARWLYRINHQPWIRHGDDRMGCHEGLRHRLGGAGCRQACCGESIMALANVLGACLLAEPDPLVQPRPCR